MKRTITIVEDDRPVIMFPAPDDMYVARSLWVFLVDYLQPGFVVHLTVENEDGEVITEATRPSAEKVTPKIHRELMKTEKLDLDSD